MRWCGRLRAGCGDTSELHRIRSELVAALGGPCAPHLHQWHKINLRTDKWFISCARVQGNLDKGAEHKRSGVTIAPDPDTTVQPAAGTEGGARNGAQSGGAKRYFCTCAKPPKKPPGMQKKKGKPAKLNPAEVAEAKAKKLAEAKKAKKAKEEEDAKKSPLPEPITKLIKGLQKELIAHKVIPETAGQIGLIYTDGFGKQTAHLDSYKQFDTVFFLVGGIGKYSRTEAWDSGTNSWTSDLPGDTDERWTRSSCQLHRGVGIASEGDYSIVAYFPEDAPAPKLKESTIPIVGRSCKEFSEAWGSVCSMYTYGLEMGQGAAAAVRREAPQTPKQSGKAKKNDGAGSLVQRPTPQGRAAVEDWWTDFLSVGNFKNDGGAGVNAEPWVEQLAKMGPPAVKMVQTAGYGRGLVATETVGKDQKVAIFTGNTATTQDRCPMNGGSAKWAIGGGGSVVSLDTDQANAVAEYAMRNQAAAQACGVFANHQSKGLHGRQSNCRHDTLGAVKKIVAKQVIEAGEPIVMKYNESPMLAEWDGDLLDWELCLHELQRKHKVEVLRRDWDSDKKSGDFGTWSYVEGKVKGCTGLAVKPSTVPEAGLGLFASPSFLDAAVTNSQGCVITVEDGPGLTLVVVPAGEDVNDVTSTLEELFPVGARYIIRHAYGDKWLLVLPTSSFQAAAPFMCNASAGGRRFNGGVGVKFDAAPVFKCQCDGGRDDIIVGVQLKLLANHEDLAFASGWAKATGAVWVELFASYAATGAGHADVDESNRTGPNPYVVVKMFAARHKDPHQATKAKRSECPWPEHACTWMLPLETAMETIASKTATVQWQDIEPKPKVAQHMLRDGRPMLMCGLMIAAYDGVVAAVLESYKTKTCAGTNWYSGKTREVLSGDRERTGCQQKLQQKLTRLLDDGPVMALGRGPGGKYIAVLRTERTAHTAYSWGFQPSYGRSHKVEAMAEVVDFAAIWVQYARVWPRPQQKRKRKRKRKKSGGEVGRRENNEE